MSLLEKISQEMKRLFNCHSYREMLPYGGYCNNQKCSTIHVKGSTNPSCSCGELWSDHPNEQNRKLLSES